MFFFPIPDFALNFPNWAQLEFIFVKQMYKCYRDPLRAFKCIMTDHTVATAQKASDLVAPTACQLVL